MSIDDEPRPRGKSKRFALIVALIVIIALIILVGYNLFYVLVARNG